MSDWIAAALLVAGGFFCLVAALGVLRFGDVFCRMHAATKAGTLGLALVCLAEMLLAKDWAQLFETLFVFLFMIATAPIGAHLIGRAAFRTRAPVSPGTESDPGAEAFRARSSG
ncbi:MAG: monovalent cation/H(+) antiporter subunit G [Amaricoccus sp.]